MTWPVREAIADSVVRMLQVNMGLRPHERLLVVTDLPRPEDWQTADDSSLEDMLERAVLARLVGEIARSRFPENPVTFHPFPATGGHGKEPDPGTAAAMREAEVVIALTTYSLSHTNARQEATQRGARVASMPTFEAPMFEAGGPMAVDYQEVARDCRRMAGLLTQAQEAVVRTPAGTDLRFSLAGRPGQSDDGLYTAPGLWGNLPAGEAFIVPVEGTAEGRLVVPPGWYPGLTEELVLTFREGLVTEVRGGGRVGEELRGLLSLGSDEPVLRARRNLAELGIGCNPNARRPDNVLEAEKIQGTVHLAIGDNIHMGGLVEADLHEDYVQPEVDLLLDGQPAILSGRWVV
ncbi:MAG: aminopeptidase [Anaerolineae bacterium]|nr:aminopeptidase [Anaerolineae bacterium]